MENEPKIEVVVDIKQMPTKPVLEAYLRGMLGDTVSVRFNYEEGVFDAIANPAE